MCLLDRCVAVLSLEQNETIDLHPPRTCHGRSADGFRLRWEESREDRYGASSLGSQRGADVPSSTCGRAESRHSQWLGRAGRVGIVPSNDDDQACAGLDRPARQRCDDRLPPRCRPSRRVGVGYGRRKWRLHLHPRETPRRKGTRFRRRASHRSKPLDEQARFLLGILEPTAAPGEWTAAAPRQLCSQAPVTNLGHNSPLVSEHPRPHPSKHDRGSARAPARELATLARPELVADDRLLDGASLVQALDRAAVRRLVQ